MNRVSISTNEFNNEKEFHDLLIEKFDLPDYYGRNLDALWDYLTGWIDLPVVVEWTEVQRAEEDLGDRAELFLEVFIRAEYELRGLFSFIYG